MKNFSIWTLMLLGSLTSYAQIGCFARVELDTRSVYVQQPFKVTFTVLTATWYTAPLEFENLQVPNAFIIPFDRTMPGMFKVGDKQYAGLQFYYIVFPYKAGSFTLPPIKIVATTPPEGQSTSRKITIATAPQKYQVKSVPGDFKGNWMVAKNVIITQNWNKALRNLKVGDVIERRVTENASGTLPQFIPELEMDSLSWASIYPQDADLRDTRNEYDVNGVRTQNFTYLLEKEGDYEFPASHVKWWNPYSHKVFQRSTGEIKIHVAANPNLGILATIKDSLVAKQATVAVAKPHTGPYKIFGIAWYWFVLYTMAGLVVVYSLGKLTLAGWRFARQLYQNYVHSESYWFRKFERSPLLFPGIFNSLYRWWDRSMIPGRQASIIEDACKRHDDAIAKELDSLYKEVFDKDNASASASQSLKAVMRRYRASNGAGAIRQADNDQDPWPD